MKGGKQYEKQQNGISHYALRENLRLRANEKANRLSRSVARLTSCDRLPCPEYRDEVRAISNFSDFLTRKLFTYNAASCVIAYIGALLGYTDYGEAANDPVILALLDKNYTATNVAMCQRFGYEMADQTEFAALSKKKFCDRTIVDTVARNAREPHRKLGAGERIIGAAALLREQGQDASVLELTAAAALLYNDPADATWTGMQQEKGIAGILSDVCGLQPEDALYKNISANIQRLSEDAPALIREVAGK